MNITVTGTPSTSLLMQMAAGNVDNFTCVLTNTDDDSVSVTGDLATTYIDPDQAGDEISYIFLINPTISVTSDTITVYKNDEAVVSFLITPVLNIQRGLQDIIINIPRNISVLKEVMIKNLNDISQLVSWTIS